MKAIENVVGIMMANYAYPSICYYPGAGTCNGNSCGYDWNGDVFIEANVTEQVVIGKFDMNEIRKAR